MGSDLSYGARARGALERGDFRFARRLGQNFLLDDAVLDDIAARAGVQAGDAVLEIGPGAGTLTAALLRRGARVLAIELDAELEPVLRSLLGGQPGFELIMADALKCDTEALRARLEALRAPGGRLCVTANLPYYITGDILARYALGATRFDMLCVLVQREAAERMAARVGEAQYCLLSAQLGWRYELESVMELSRELFTPRPHVDSTLIRLTPRATPPAPVRDEAMLQRVLRAAFLMRRKTMLNNICAAFKLPRADAQAVLEAAGLAANVRGEALEPEQLARLSDALSVRLGAPDGALK